MLSVARERMSTFRCSRPLTDWSSVHLTSAGRCGCSRPRLTRRRCWWPSLSRRRRDVPVTCRRPDMSYRTRWRLYSRGRRSDTTASSSTRCVRPTRRLRYSLHSSRWSACSSGAPPRQMHRCVGLPVKERRGCGESSLDETSGVPLRGRPLVGRRGGQVVCAEEVADRRVDPDVLFDRESTVPTTRNRHQFVGHSRGV